ncbi:polycomb protein suz12 isoform X2 [Parasteatoda tepidariorum]|uniref:polycomb protein suz12 isoform X2 n=1 Tax=Parasteatoda tepidariorum TaxID=114398 RepID=UPI00077F9FEE|nr:polycomb protein suz12 isoform X2 [Parasteatoda tepidariorum]
MPPKKREKPTEKETSTDQIKTERELFLQAFEKPTQIYRFLGTRQINSPLFLQRCLSYMKHRMSRTHAKRKFFKVDSILERVTARHRALASERPSGHLIITFTGYYDKMYKGSGDTVCVEASLSKICHKKRKDVSSPAIQMSVGKCEVHRNPDMNNPPAKVTAISVPNDNFNISNGNLVKSYVLLLRVTCPVNRMKLNGFCNGDISDVTDEPAQKKRKSLKNQSEEVRIYGAELVVYDKHQRCLLTDGEYQLVLQELGQKSSPKKLSSWETFPDSKDKTLNLVDVFGKGPLVTFHLQWKDNLVSGMVDRPLPSARPDDLLNLDGLSSLKQESVLQERGKKTRVYYQFLYNNNTRQQTEARDDFQCPWCRVNCMELYCLLKHLKLCHSRFNFNYVPHSRGARIDVSINESYDGSYVGNPNDLHSTGFAFSRTGPARRNPVTHVIVCRPKRPAPSLSEFLEAEDIEPDGHRSYISGHNRLYYHTVTCLSVRPQEIDIDSESENDPTWLRIKTQHMIDEFTDVNEGEKELMKMWNLHVMKYGFVGDCQIPLACSMFIEEHGLKIVTQRLYRNFLLHLCNLFDYGLISASVVYHTMHQLNQIRDEIENKNCLLWSS